MRKRALFKRYPLDGQVTVAGETLTTPYHIYNGTMLFFGGTVDGAAASDFLSREGLPPIHDESGRALAAVWVCDFTEANLGPHHELQISLFTAPHPIAPVPTHPFAVFRALLSHPETQMVCHGLWNNTQRVVRYNAEHLGLAACFASSSIGQSDGQWQFGFADEAGHMIAEGNAQAASRQSPRVLWQMLRHIGLKGMLRLIRSPFVHVPVVNTRSLFSDRTLLAHTYSRSARQTVQYFGPEGRLEIGHPVYARLDFKPDFMQQVDGVNFVYLRPAAYR